jgi:hypothetical protein
VRIATRCADAARPLPLRCILVVRRGSCGTASAEGMRMSNQNGPAWYPSKQFTHTPDVPGVPASATTSAAAPSTTRPYGLRRLLDKLVGRSRPTSTV